LFALIICCYLGILFNAFRKGYVALLYRFVMLCGRLMFGKSRVMLRFVRLWDFVMMLNYL